MAYTSSIEKVVAGVSALQLLACPLVTPGSNLSGRWGLSKYWAQEYVGADLARARLQEQGVQYASSAAAEGELLEIWDGIATHAVRVSNLIAGPAPSALVPARASAKHTNMVTFWTKFSFNAYVRNYEIASQLVQQRQNYAFYLNNSMEWNHSGQLLAIFQRLANRGVSTITSAGNSSQVLDSVKVQLAQERKIILVASLDPWGNYSSVAPSAATPIIAAGAHQDLTSFDASGTEKLFGGASGATPQVTAALLAFTLITGIHLPPAVALTLLEKTAINFGSAEGHLVTMLNSLKIVELGFFLQEKCRQSAACIFQHFKGPHFAEIDFDATGAIKIAQQVFPHCFRSPKVFPAISASCSQQQEAFQALRRAALLQGNNAKLWDLVACISNWNGLTINGAFYQRLARGVQRSSKISWSN